MNTAKYQDDQGKTVAVDKLPRIDLGQENLKSQNGKTPGPDRVLRHFPQFILEHVILKMGAH